MKLRAADKQHKIQIYVSTLHFLFPPPSLLTSNFNTTVFFFFWEKEFIKCNVYHIYEQTHLIGTNVLEIYTFQNTILILNGKWTINQIKFWVSKINTVCRNDKERVREIYHCILFHLKMSFLLLLLFNIIIRFPLYFQYYILNELKNF